MVCSLKPKTHLSPCNLKTKNLWITLTTQSQLVAHRIREEEKLHTEISSVQLMCVSVLKPSSPTLDILSVYTVKQRFLLVLQWLKHIFSAVCLSKLRAHWSLLTVGNTLMMHNDLKQPHCKRSMALNWWLRAAEWSHARTTLYFDSSTLHMVIMSLCGCCSVLDERTIYISCQTMKKGTTEKWL